MRVNIYFLPSVCMVRFAIALGRMWVRIYTEMFAVIHNWKHWIFYFIHFKTKRRLDFRTREALIHN